MCERMRTYRKGADMYAWEVSVCEEEVESNYCWVPLSTLLIMFFIRFYKNLNARRSLPLSLWLSVIFEYLWRTHVHQMIFWTILQLFCCLWLFFATMILLLNVDVIVAAAAASACLFDASVFDIFTLLPFEWKQEKMAP